MYALIHLAVLLLGITSANAIAIPKRAPSCQSFSSNFPAGSVADHDSPSPATEGARFVAISPKGSFTTGTDNEALVLKLKRPDGQVKTLTDKDGRKHNDKIGVGATVNMTAMIGMGKVSFEVEAPKVPGVVTAVILVGDDSGDELDVEILGGQPDYWTSNMFATPPGEQPLYGEFGKNLDYKKQDGSAGGNVGDKHTYTIDWNEKRIIWSVDGVQKRTLKKDSKDSRAKNGKSYYPTHSLRVQMGIWDASLNPGTTAWAKGPMNWNEVKEDIRALVRRVTIDCGDS